MARHFDTDDVGREREIEYLNKETALLRARASNAQARRTVRQERYFPLIFIIPFAVVIGIPVVVWLLSRSTACIR